MRLILFVFAAAGSLLAQTSGTITGHVLASSTGEALSGAEVTATQQTTGFSRTALTGETGRYVLAVMPAGAYDLRANADGFQSLQRTGVVLTVGETIHVDLELEVGSVEFEVTVTADTPLVNTQTSELSYLVEEEAIRELPLNGRNYTDLALLQPSVIAFPNRDGGSIVAHGLGMSINGQDPRSNVYLIDGTTQNDFTNSPAGSAASTVLGTETIREFRVETNAYSAEFGRNSGGQINALTKSGTNEVHGALFYFHRNDNLDTRNFFDGAEQPEFRRHQFGGTVGGPIRKNKTFFFAGYEALQSDRGRTINSVTITEEAREGPVDPAVQPYLDEFPLPNGRDLGGGLGELLFFFNEETNQDFVQGRIDHIFSSKHQFFTRYTLDDARQDLPTDFPQFPRRFVSRNQFLTAELSSGLSPRVLNNLRFGFSRTNIGQDVEANTSRELDPFVPGRALMGDIDIGGIPRFGPQISVDVNLVQNIFSIQEGLTLIRGAHTIKVGGLVEHYQDEMVNPTFSLGLFAFANLEGFKANRPLRFIGLTPEGDFARDWPFTLFGGYIQDDWTVTPRLTLNLGMRYETITMPIDQGGRDSALINLSDTEPTVGRLFEGPPRGNVSPRFGFAWDVLGDASVSLRGGYGWYYNTNFQQNLIVTVTNPPATPRIVQGGPTFPQPDFERSGSVAIRPIEWNLKNPNVHVWNMNVQKRLPSEILLTLGYAGSRGVHLLRNTDANIPEPERLDDGRVFFPAGLSRPNPAFSAVELKKSDGNSWYNALLVEVRKRFGRGLSFQSSYTFSRNIDTTQSSTFFSDSTNGTTSAFPEFSGFSYNKGLADFHAKHNWVFNFNWEIPFGSSLAGPAKAVLDGWQFAGIATVRSGQPVTAFVQRNRSRSLWSPSLGPGLGNDRPDMAPGFSHDDAVLADPNQWFNPAAFALQEAGTLGNLGRGALLGPDLRSLNFAAMKNFRAGKLGESTRIQFRAEFFNLFNRPNFSSPALQAFSGVSDNEQTLSSFGRIRSTVTESRQIQLGLRISF